MEDLDGMLDAVPRALEPSWVMQSFSAEATWTHLFIDFVIMMGALFVGMLAYLLLPTALKRLRHRVKDGMETQHRLESWPHGAPWKMITLDVSNLDEHNPMHCYTEEEAVERYGADEGQSFGEDFQICGQKLPKARALKFAVHCGPKVAEVFHKLSYEEKHALMNGVAQLPEDLLQESLREHYAGSDLAHCDGCKATPAKGEDAQEVGFTVCPRCRYTACKDCQPDYKLGRCYCLNSNFGEDYPHPSKRTFHQTGIW